MSDLNMSVVVDSPIATPAAQETHAPSPIEAFIPKATAQGPTPSAPAAPAPVAAPVVSTPPPVAQSTQADQVRQLGETYGMDLSRFPDVASAEAAVAMMADRFAQMGAQAPEQDADMFPVQPAQYQQQWTPPVPQPATVVPQVPALDDKQVDPTIVAAFNAQKVQIEQLRDTVQQMQASQETQKAKQFTAVQAEIGRRAQSAIDSLNSPKYGNAAKRDEAQTLAAQNVLNKAGQIIRGYVAARQPLPTVETIIGMAVKADKSWGPSAQAAAPTAPVSPSVPYSLPPNNPSSPGIPASGTLPRISKANDPYGMFQDPVIRAIFSENLSR